jgi:hypothetical protein
MALLLFAFISSASADQTISEPGEGAGQTQNPQGLATDFETGRLYVADSGNHRIDVFSSTGSFEMSFGWGVADGKAELQSCGPAATPPTTSCRKGLQGGGAGEFTNLGDIAVDNDPTSTSHHVVYVLDETSRFFGQHDFRVEKFTPDGGFLLTWGAGVITSGAAGTGNLTNGSTQVTNVQTTKKRFEVGQVITGPGIPTGTRIVGFGVAAGTLALSKAANASGTAVALNVAEGPGNVPVNEIDKLVTNTAETRTNFAVITLDPSPTQAQTLLPNGVSGPELQAALEALPNVGPGNVKVIGEKEVGAKHEYTVEFTGSRFADSDVFVQGGTGLGSTQVFTLQNGGSGAEICGAGSAESCADGVEATEGAGPARHGKLGRSAKLATGPGGIVYIADCVRAEIIANCGDATQSESSLQKFEASGVFAEELELTQSRVGPTGIAADSNGNFYASLGDAIYKYGPTGDLLDQLLIGHGPGALSVDSADNLYASESDQQMPVVDHKGWPVIAEYAPAGDTVRRFGYGTLASSPNGLAPYQSPSGDIYTAESNFAVKGVLHRSFPPPGPIVVPQPCKTSFLGNTRATLLAEVNPEGNATTAHFEYISDADFTANGGSFSGAHPATSTEESESIGSDFFLHDAEAQAELVPETEYHCRAIATNADAPAGVVGPEGTFTSNPPLEFGATSVSSVGTETATLNAAVNPLGIETTGFFEYVEEATYLKDIEELGPGHGFDHSAKAPDVDGAEEPIDFGAGESLKVGSVNLSSLDPGTSYRYRIVATDSYFPVGLPGATKAFRTLGVGAGALPDDRAWELVSPAQKNSAEVAMPSNATGLNEIRTVRIQAGASSGEAVTYTSFTSFGDAEAAPATSQYLSKRTPSGWATENISPFGISIFALVPPYSGFTPDLGFGAFRVREPALTADCPEGFPDLYLRDNQSGALHCLSSDSEAPNVAKGEAICFAYAGASEDGSRAFFASNAAYVGAPVGHGFSLYEWSTAKGLQPVSVLPGKSEAVAPTPATSYGAAAGSSTFVECQVGLTTLRHVVSADGKTAFWTYAPATGTPKLMARINGEETIQLDAKPTANPGKGPFGEGKFLTANADGSKAFFTAPGKLTADAKAAGQLYSYDTVARTLSDLTPGEVAPEVQGVIGASDDGSRLYFVAKGVLTGSEENDSGEKALTGRDNLYLYHEGEGLRFIATLSNEDERDWETQPTVLSARVSPDGQHLAFLSIEAEALAGYDNTIASGEHCRWEQVPIRELVGGPLCGQAFLYDAAADTLTCASCNPSGSRPLGPAVLPVWTNVYEGPRYLSDNGSKLFFESFDALTAADQNGKRDVYEFERPGSGSCSGQSPAFDPASGGCHFLISSGNSIDETYLVDASSSGRDVFFSTRSPLLGRDVNQNYDIYDAREGGGFPEPVSPPICQGEACKAPASSPPGASAPATPNFVGPGNQVQKHKKKAKQHRKKVKHKSKKRQAKANRERRVER